MKEHDISCEHYKVKFKEYISFEDIIADEYSIIGRKIAEVISKRFKEKISCLDIGCGTGRMPNTLIKLLDASGIGIVFDYLDPATESLEIYRNNVPSLNRRKAINSDLANFFCDKEYDLLLANNSLCGYDISREKNIIKLLLPIKESGLTIITLPSNESDWVKYADMFWGRLHGDKPKKTRFESLIDAFNKYGIQYQSILVNAPLLLSNKDSDSSLRAIFNVMLYSDQTYPDYRSCFQSFKKEVLQNGKLDFVYGITVAEK